MMCFGLSEQVREFINIRYDLFLQRLALVEKDYPLSILLDVTSIRLLKRG